MVIAIPLAVQTDYTELRYALRSIDKYLPPLEVVIIGEHIPWWLHNVTQIAVRDINNKKQLNIRKKVLAALEYSDEIFFTNDDIFFMCSADPYNYPNYTNGELIKQAEPGAKQLAKKLEEMGKPTRHYDCHYPIRYDQRFKELTMFGSGCILKSMYGNYFELEATEVQDCKINRKVSEAVLRSMTSFMPCVSTGPVGLPYLLPVLEEMFPDKSIKFEV